jgi:hypothetical protein
VRGAKTRKASADHNHLIARHYISNCVRDVLPFRCDNEAALIMKCKWHFRAFSFRAFFTSA